MTSYNCTKERVAQHTDIITIIYSRSCHRSLVSALRFSELASAQLTTMPLRRDRAVKGF